MKTENEKKNSDTLTEESCESGNLKLLHIRSSSMETVWRSQDKRTRQTGFLNAKPHKIQTSFDEMQKASIKPVYHILHNKAKQS